MRLDEIDPTKAVTLCLYGGAGTSKTWICGTAGDRTLYCDVENRLATLKSPLFRQRYKFNPRVIQVFEQPIPDGGAKALVELQNKINDEVDHHADEFDTLIVDGATSVIRFAQNLALEVNLHSGRVSSDKKNKIKTYVKDFPYTEISVNDYQTQMDMMLSFMVSTIEWCKESNKNFVFTAHQRVNFRKKEKVGDADIIDKIYPGFTGKTFPDSIPGLFDLVWHTEVDGGVYRVRTEGHGSLIAKTCYSGLFPNMIRDCNLSEVFKAIQTNTPYPKKGQN